MTTVTLTMPRLGETMEEGTVAEWLVAEGAEFDRGTPLVEFETDKTAVEYPALGKGRLAKTLVSKGDIVKLGDPIAQIDLLGNDDWVSAPQEPDTQGASQIDDTPEADSVTVELAMPRLGETMEEGKIISWMVAPGESYARGAPMLEVETDKTVAEFPALVSGRLVETLVEAGEMVKVGSAIAHIEIAVSDLGDSGATAVAQSASTSQPAPIGTSNAQAADIRRDRPVRATPLARRAARKSGIILTKLRGTGRRGRIELSDVQRAISGAPVSPLAATTWGPQDGPKVLMVHGFAGDRVTFEQLGKTLGRAGISARAVDLPGHGGTTQDARGFDDLTGALVAELDPARPVHLVAHSLGAAAAVAAAAQAGGVASLTLIAPAGLGLAIDSEFVEGMARAESPGAVGHLLRRLSARAEFFSSSLVAQIHAELARGRVAALAADFCRGGQQAINVRSMLAKLAEEMPVKVLLGQEDRIIEWRDALDVSPAIALHIFSRAGHLPHWDEPALVATLIEKGITHGRQ